MEDLVEIGTVKEIVGAEAIVEVERASACAHCVSKHLCFPEGASSLLIRVANSIGAKVGDRVKLSLRGRTFLWLSFLVYLVPLLLFFPASYLGGVVSSHFLPGRDPQLLELLFGVGAVVVSFFLVRAYNKRLTSKKRCLVEIVGII